MHHLHRYLMLAGLIPFVGLSCAQIFEISLAPLIHHNSNALNAYSFIIAAFMAGTHWGQSILLVNHNSFNKRKLFLLTIMSNINALLLFFALVFIPEKLLISVIILVFLLILGCDYRLYQEKILTKPYMIHRSIISLTVILSLLSVFLNRI